MPEEHRELPLFPLNTVLLPHMSLPLRIFEPRYRQMLSYCVERDKTFGVVLIKAGSEVGAPALPYDIGTTAIIENVETLADGTIGVMTRGERRFQIDSMIDGQPFQMAAVTMLEEDQTQLPEASFQEIRALAQQCLQHWLALNHQWARDIGLPRNQERFSYVLPTRLEMDNRIRQILLESPTLATRLEDERTILEEEEKRLRRLIQEEAWLNSNLN